MKKMKPSKPNDSTTDKVYLDWLILATEDADSTEDKIVVKSINGLKIMTQKLKLQSDRLTMEAINDSKNIKYIPDSFQVNRVKIDTANFDAIELLANALIEMKDKINSLVLSAQSLETLNMHPEYLKKIRPFFIDEEQDNEEILKQETKRDILHERLLAVARDTSISLLDRRVHLFLCGLQVQSAMRHTENLFNYEKIAEELVPVLEVAKEQIFKSLDTLVQKKWVRVINFNYYGRNVQFFRLSDYGPIDLNSNFNVGFESSGSNHDQ